MAKFYVQSGLISHLVTANDAYSAALWTMHLAMEEVVPVDEVDWLSEEELPESGYEDGLMKLGATIEVSEIGFGRTESGVFDTADTLAEWNSLVIAVARLEARLAEQMPSENRMTELADLLNQVD